MKRTDPHADVTATNPPTTDGRWTFALNVPCETDAQFQARLEALRTEFNPVGLLEALIFDRLVEAMVRLRECARNRPDVPSNTWLRAESQADRLFWRAYRELIASQKRRSAESPAASGPQPVARKSRKVAEPTTEPRPQPEPQPPIELDPAPVNWRERIALDPGKSLYWPVIRGTQVTAEQVAAMLEENWPIRDILRYFPFLSLDDIRACRDCNAENMCGPWDPED
jgi:uncharacterized protein (DUF433 family)